MTAYEEKLMKIEALRLTGFQTEPIWVYEPGLLDRIVPNVIAGYPIEYGTRVIVTKRNVDPAGIIRWIMDRDGNEQSVYKNALRRV